MRHLHEALLALLVALTSAAEVVYVTDLEIYTYLVRRCYINIQSTLLNSSRPLVLPVPFLKTSRLRPTRHCAPMAKPNYRNASVQIRPSSTSCLPPCPEVSITAAVRVRPMIKRARPKSSTSTAIKSLKSHSRHRRII